MAEHSCYLFKARDLDVVLEGTSRKPSVVDSCHGEADPTPTLVELSWLRTPASRLSGTRYSYYLKCPSPFQLFSRWGISLLTRELHSVL